MASAAPSNPFDGFDTYSTVAQQPPQQQMQQQQQPPPNQWGQQTTQQQQQSVSNPFAAAPAPVLPPTNAPFAMPQQQMSPQAGVASPGMVPQPGMVQPQQPMQQQMGMPQYPPQQAGPQLQIAQHPHQPTQQPMQQQLVPMAPNAIVTSPWALQPGVGGVPPAAGPPAAGGQPYDPLGIFGSSAQQQPAAPVPPQQQQFQQPAYQAQQQTQMQPQYAQQPAQSPSAQQKLSNEVNQFNLEKQNESLLPDEEEDEGLALIDVELDDDDDNTANLEDRKKDGDFLEGSAIHHKKHSKSSRKSSGGQQRNSWDRNPDIAPPPPPTPGRNQSEYLAQHSAPALSSPLPRPELVHHSGFVLSRISFRTVLMRKWKQTFWIQYGPTQLLFFRNFADYEDWLNNPYHTMKAREYLVKLRVDFVSDLKKSSVMGYQVTQVRRKPYGKNVMLHFKLERWMDYGPTIAAAFAAREEEMVNSPTHRRNGNNGDTMNTSNDVSSLRKIILGCMRNARDAALVASREQSDMGEAVGYRGRYDAEYSASSRIPSGSGNMGYHQAFSAESSGRRRMVPDSDVQTEESRDSENEMAATANATAAPPVVDLLG